MNQQFDNKNSGAVFVNDRKRGENSPDFKGSCEVELPDGSLRKYWISAWKKRSRAGKGFLSLAFTPDEADHNQKPADKAETDDFDFDDDIPF